MSKELFDVLLVYVEPYISHSKNHALPISPAERLAVTLRYLATGDSQQTICFSYCIGKSTMSSMLKETCMALWRCLKDKYLLLPTTAVQWKNIASGFSSDWQLKNCIGALDGKHVRIQAPKHSGSEFYNYKGYFSIVLLAVCDSKYKFTMVDVGASGHQSDGGILRNSKFWKYLTQGKLNIPNTPVENGYHIPFYFVGDEAFPLRTDLMRPYPGKMLPKEKAIFNYRLSRGRRTIENAFGILANRWRILRREINLNIETAKTVVLACCVLHNFLIIHEEKLPSSFRRYNPVNYCDREDYQGHICNGEWREEGSSLHNVCYVSSNNHSRVAAKIRDKLAKYFLSPQGELPWQNAVVNRTGAI